MEFDLWFAQWGRNISNLAYIHEIFFLHVSKSQYFFPYLNSNCSNLLNLRKLQEQVKKHSVN